MMLWLVPSPGVAQEVDVSGSADAGDASVEIDTADSGDEEGLSVAKEWRSPVQVSVSINAGYDDDSSRRRDSGSQGSAFTSALVALTYSFAGPRFSGSLATDAAFNYYPGLDNDEIYQPNAHLDATLNYALNPRVALSSTASVVYRSEPDISLIGTADRQSGPHWIYSGSLGTSYAWLPRFSTSTTYSVTVIDYETEGLNARGRISNAISQGFNYAVLPGKTLIATYSASFVTYDAGGDALSQSITFGTGHAFNPFLTGSINAGVQFYTSTLPNGFETTRTSPNIQGSLSYALGSTTSLSWNAGYSIEESDSIFASSRQTFRTGLEVSQSLIGRLAGTASAYYRHDENDGGGLVGNSFSQDSVDISLGLSYALRPNISASANYQHTQLRSSGPAVDSYSRNRYTLGLRVNF